MKEFTKEDRSLKMNTPENDDFGAGYKYCNHCTEPKPLTEFSIDPCGVYGRSGWCKDCTTPTEDVLGPKKISNDRIQQALEAAAYRIIKESM